MKAWLVRLAERIDRSLGAWVLMLQGQRCLVCRKLAWNRFGDHWYCDKHHDSVRTA